ncbi:MAG TPA: glycosyltransferase family 2 protein [Chloroflexus aurantiacus]|jgi:GT2 family glycosyltransferase|uniref:Glycosyl transferase family 2 n=1 Tax=Chloroflexus aurantiacus (strain ATCC 29366 / DSM 635 / J-10-fl) TaxID=324602 RepID=A9WA57_CHLAA|nr:MULTISPECIES: glycosyltransferase family 2 protein [Chloroflexus]ABY36739.1 glycosyl transferase family 2 [Chloroflexus aurantiacus J-10-fl]RMG49800.1 MAG: glycosyltransferase family 2 protein [Chloroflexota bacterium]HBW66393.1 glycosyltransferase family 2 protein [Chloroflexus aurantiacus]
MLAIIIVSWNVRDLLRRCLSAVQAALAAGNLSAEIIVVDNDSHDGTAAMIRQEFPAVHVIEAGANLGFTAANNLALRTLLARPDGGPEFILFLNPDTEPQADAIPRLVGFLQEHPAAIAVGPRLLYSDGSQQSSRRRFPTPLTMIWESTPWERLWPRNPWARAYHCADRSADRVQRVGWLVGAALLVRTTAIRQAGLLDERFFMYSEELEWQWRLQWQNPVAPAPDRSRREHVEVCSQIWYLPDAVVIHHEGKSSEQVPLVRHRYFQQSRLLLARMWYGWVTAALLRRLICLGYQYELIIEALKLALGHRPELRRQRIVLYQQVLYTLNNTR